MTFYIKPPEGNIGLKKLHQDAEIRLHFLYEIHQLLDEEKQMRKIFTRYPNLALNSECLIDGSQRDRISHFILRLASKKSRSFQIFLTDAETSLFQYRLLKGGQVTIKQSLKILRRHTRFALKHQILSFHHQELLEQIQEVVEQILTSSMLSCQNDESCHHLLKVPWTMVLSLVRDRLVVVHGGQADIPCHLLLQFLCSVFSAVLKHGIEELSSQTIDHEMCLSDQRISAISQSLRRLFISKCGGNQKQKILYNITHRDVENESKFFPLCMQQLHQTLRKTNRLRHHARLRYTLFLKDIGLPVDENIKFWEYFYSKTCKGSGTGCNHSWLGNDGNRYRYSIRHVYGFEGGRINYTSHSCHALQATKPQPSEMSGCPFSGGDTKELYSYLKTTFGDQPFLKNLMLAVEENKPSIACKLLMKFSLQLIDKPNENLKFSLQLIDKPNENQILQIENRATEKANSVYKCEDYELLKSKYTESCDKTMDLNKCVFEVCGCHSSSSAVNQSTPHLKNHYFERIPFNEKCRKTCLVSEDEHKSSCGKHPCEKCRNGVTKRDVITENGPSTHESNLKSKIIERHNCPSVCDIEDLPWLSECNFLRPSQFYFQVKDNIKRFKCAPTSV